MNPIVEKLRRGDVVVGGWLSFAGSHVAELMGRLPFDWVALDWEHGAMNPESIEQMLQALHSARMPSLVRIPEHSLVHGHQSLDMGAGGIIVPMVNSAAQARESVAALRFPPQGRRSVGLGRWRMVMEPDPTTANQEVAVILMIENAAAVEQIEEILSVEGMDAFFVGPTDLAASLGGDAAKVEQAIERVIQAGRRRGVPGGIHAHTADQARGRIGQGFQFIALSEAGLLIQQAAGELLRQLRG